MTRLLTLLALLAGPALAAWPPVAVTDPVPGATHCALIVDGARLSDVPVVDGACRIDVSMLAQGARRVQILAIRIDASGRTESSPTAPLCALVHKPSTSGFRIGWASVVTCTRTGGCRNPCI